NLACCPRLRNISTELAPNQRATGDRLRAFHDRRLSFALEEDQARIKRSNPPFGAMILTFLQLFFLHAYGRSIELGPYVSRSGLEPTSRPARTRVLRRPPVLRESFAASKSGF